MNDATQDASAATTSNPGLDEDNSTPAPPSADKTDGEDDCGESPLDLPEEIEVGQYDKLARREIDSTEKYELLPDVALMMDGLQKFPLATELALAAEALERRP